MTDKQTSDEYVFGKEYIRNALIRAFNGGLAHNGYVSDRTAAIYADESLDDMIRDQKPIQREQNK